MVGLLDSLITSAIEQVIKRGNDAEVKMVHGSIVVVEIRRKTTYKTVTTG